MYLIHIRVPCNATNVVSLSTTPWISPTYGGVEVLNTPSISGQLRGPAVLLKGPRVGTDAVASRRHISPGIKRWPSSLYSLLQWPLLSYLVTRYSDSGLYPALQQRLGIETFKIFLFLSTTEVYMASKHGTVSKRRHFSHIFLCMRSEFTQTCVSFVSVPGAAGSWKRIHRVMVSWAWKSYDTLNWDSMSVRLSHTLKQICFEAINQWNRASVFITHVGLRGPRSTNSRSHTAKKLISWCALKALVYSRAKEMAESVLKFVL